MPRIISSVSSKGGAGKTTIVILIGGEWASKGKRVLLIENDEKGNLLEWWQRCEQKGNLPENMDIEVALTPRKLDEALQDRARGYDYVIIDSPGLQTSRTSAVIRASEVILVPVQPNQDEIKAAGQAAEAIGDATDEDHKFRLHVNIATRITLPNRQLEAYRTIRPFVANLQAAGYDSMLAETELNERNCYREIRNGYGTLQMLEHTPAILKGRLEVRALTEEIEKVLHSVDEKRSENA
ncbi:ParA family protein [Notoacmeibacter sp. MSK16QG-6]|uniref:ParA family protein n=1 Tax=Notoacmeibacter sp. MSK16QG-6 TaxID=2957982 RepID=UPI00209D5891|nr:ParA family protein [Notoacmeibacter sp. MSK16QG-6]MCP1201115.1 ParA family protein [Notoacmeibacter sp. MSK16QG-6]